MTGQQVHRIEGRAITVAARLVPKFLWFTAAIEVFVDGQRLLSSGGRLALSGTEAAFFNGIDGSPHDLQLSWNALTGYSGYSRYSRYGLVPQLHYTLVVDGSARARGEVGAQNWWMRFAGLALVLTAVLLLLGRGITASFSEMEKKLQAQSGQGGGGNTNPFSGIEEKLEAKRGGR